MLLRQRQGELTIKTTGNKMTKEDIRIGLEISIDAETTYIIHMI